MLRDNLMIYGNNNSNEMIITKNMFPTPALKQKKHIKKTPTINATFNP